MLSQIKARCAERRADEEGFTLIELMVVVLIIAILIAIAIPTFLGARQKAQDRAAQSDLRNALTAAKTAYVDSEDYTVAATELASVEPSLTYISGGTASTAARFISVAAPDSNSLGMAALSADGTCWQLFDSTATGSAGTTFGSTGGACTAPTGPLTGAHPDHW
jgi:type IV pilus assembly protein PilA